MASKREERTAAALGRMTDMSARVAAAASEATLKHLAERAWALRARVVDLRGIRATYVVSGKALALLYDRGVSLGISPTGNEFGPAPGGTFGLLFGIPTIADAADSRHDNLSLILDGSDLVLTRAEDVEPDEVLGVGGALRRGGAVEEPAPTVSSAAAIQHQGRKIRGIEGMIEG